jgi:hypothetical protein
VLYVEVSYSVSDGRAQKAIDGKIYRLKDHSNKLSQRFSANVLQCTSDMKSKQVDSLIFQNLRKDDLIEKKDNVIEDSRKVIDDKDRMIADLQTEVALKIKEIEDLHMMLPPVVCAPLPVAEERYDAMVEERYEAMVGPSQSLAKPQVLEEPQAGGKRSINQMETDTLDLFLESLG